MGIPILHKDWIYRSIAEEYRLPYKQYDIPAGRDIMGQKVEQDYREREPYTPLHPLRIYVHLEGKRKASNRDLDVILEKAGCERIARSMFITEATKKIPFNLQNIDFTLTMCDHVPNILYEAAKEMNKPIVTTEWLIQCLINNTLLDTADSKLFTYQKSSSENNE